MFLCFVALFPLLTRKTAMLYSYEYTLYIKYSFANK